MLFANHTQPPTEELHRQPKQPPVKADLLPSHVTSAFPAAMLAAPHSPSASASSSSAPPLSLPPHRAHRSTSLAPLSSSSLSSADSSPSSATVAPISASPPLDGILRVAVSDVGMDEPPSPLGPLPHQLPQSSGLHALRSTSARKAMTSSFSDLPHFSATQQTANTYSTANDSDNTRAARTLPAQSHSTMDAGETLTI